MAELPPSEVKGVWFVAARDYARELHGDEVVDRLVSGSPAPYRDIYASPIPSAWYPESAFEQGLIVIYDVVAQGSDLMFERIMEGCTEKGIHRLFRMLLRASSPGFVLRRVPTMWRQIRRGAGHVDVETSEGGTHIRYSEFPWFHNPLYRMLTTGSLRALVRLCTGGAPRVELVEHTRDSLSVHVRYKALDTTPPSARFTSTRPPAQLRSDAYLNNITTDTYRKPDNSQVLSSASEHTRAKSNKAGTR